MHAQLRALHFVRDRGAVSDSARTRAQGPELRASPNSKSEAGEPMSSQQLLVRECLQTGTLSARPETIHYSEPYTRVIVPVIKKVCAQEIDLHPPTQVLGEKVVPAAAQNP